MPSFDALRASEIEVAAVVTNPDRPAGRGLASSASPVKSAAEAAGIEVLQPSSARAPELESALRHLGPSVCVVVAYGKILPGDLLEVPPLGFVNVHFSLLPSYRGAAPVQHALLDGASETGVSIMVLTEGMDEGPVLDARRVAIGDDDNAGTLGDRLAHEGAALLTPTLTQYASGAVTPVPQDDSAASYAPKITPESARISWERQPEEIRDQVRALTPAPGAWTTFRGKRIRVQRVEPSSAVDHLAPGELRADGRLLAGTAGPPLEVETAQMEGKRSLPGTELARGLRLAAGERFE